MAFVVRAARRLCVAGAKPYLALPFPNLRAVLRRSSSSAAYEGGGADCGRVLPGIVTTVRYACERKGNTLRRIVGPSPLVVTSLVAAGSRLLWPVRAYPNRAPLNGRRTAVACSPSRSASLVECGRAASDLPPTET